MIDKLADDIYNKIIEFNSNLNIDAIPNSDIFEKEMISLFGIERKDFSNIISLLKESHKILSIELTKEDRDNDIQRIEGYVAADLNIIRTLKNFFQAILMEEWENEFHNRLLFHQIVKEIYNRPGNFKNTPLGQIGNKAIMLDEFEGLLEKEYEQYSADWQSKKLNELLQASEFAQPAAKDTESEDLPSRETDSSAQRAVDSLQYIDFSSSQARKSLNKMLQIYGVDFYFRVNLRKYNFDLLRKVIESGEINRKIDLMSLRSMLKKVKSNSKRDVKLVDHTEDIFKLERAISRQILNSE